MTQFVYELSLQWDGIMRGAILIFGRPVHRALRRDEVSPTLARFLGLASAGFLVEPGSLTQNICFLNRENGCREKTDIDLPGFFVTREVG